MQSQRCLVLFLFCLNQSWNLSSKLTLFPMLDPSWVCTSVHVQLAQIKGCTFCSAASFSWFSTLNLKTRVLFKKLYTVFKQANNYESIRVVGPYGQSSHNQNSHGEGTKGRAFLQLGKQITSSANFQSEHLLRSLVFDSSTFCSALKIVRMHSLFTEF